MRFHVLGLLSWPLIALGFNPSFTATPHPAWEPSASLFRRTRVRGRWSRKDDRDRWTERQDRASSSRTHRTRGKRLNDVQRRMPPRRAARGGAGGDDAGASTDRLKRSVGLIAVLELVAAAFLPNTDGNLLCRSSGLQPAPSPASPPSAASSSPSSALRASMT